MKSQSKRYRYMSSTQLPWRTTRFQSERKEKKLNIIPSSTRYANKGNTELSVRDRLQKKREREKKNPRVFTNAEYSGLACACRLRIPLQSGETRVLSWSRSPDETEFKRKQDQTKKNSFFLCETKMVRRDDVGVAKHCVNHTRA